MPESHAPSQVAAFNLTIRAALPPRLRSVDFRELLTLRSLQPGNLIGSHPSLPARHLKRRKNGQPLQQRRLAIRRYSPKQA